METEKTKNGPVKGHFKQGRTSLLFFCIDRILPGRYNGTRNVNHF
ncbi:hypothetical protein B4135_3882 [Caldibacillus debilis]|uniref:Uncharacterized protein n=1 Tax=Caldibacillus debilis TaxID=301148 RepID=A0A150L9G9_9BACI|nr:hypothetical protein B4135_3882 [Caldibacillus debilis]